MAPKGGLSSGLSITICEKRQYFSQFKNSLDINRCMDIFILIAEVGAPIAGALVMGFFIFIVIKQMLDSVIDDIKELTLFTKMLEDRARVGCNELMKIDLLISHALKVTPDIDRIARAENYRTNEKGKPQDVKLDVRRD